MGAASVPGMTLNRLLITSVVVENRPVRDVADQYGVSESWLFELLARYKVEGDADFADLTEIQDPRRQQGGIRREGRKTPPAPRPLRGSPLPGGRVRGPFYPLAPREAWR